MVKNDPIYIVDLPTIKGADMWSQIWFSSDIGVMFYALKLDTCVITAEAGYVLTQNTHMNEVTFRTAYQRAFVRIKYSHFTALDLTQVKVYPGNLNAVCSYFENSNPAATEKVIKCGQYCDEANAFFHNCGIKNAATGDGMKIENSLAKLWGVHFEGCKDCVVGEGDAQINFEDVDSVISDCQEHVIALRNGAKAYIKTCAGWTNVATEGDLLVGKDSAGADIVKTLATVLADGGYRNEGFQSAQLDNLPAPAAGGTNVVAQFAGDAATGQAITALPDVPRNLQVTFGAGFTGGTITMAGLAPDGTVISEELAMPGGGGVALGVLAFASITSEAHTAGAAGGVANTADIQLAAAADTVFGVATKPLKSFGVLAADQVPEAIAAEDLVNSTFRPTSAPNAAHVYAVYYTGLAALEDCAVIPSV